MARLLTAAFLVAPLIAPCAVAQDGPAKERPNIIFIMSDDHAAHAIGAYGSRINETPQLDRLAREGMRFTNAFCTNAICAPSRAAILTGKYGHRNGHIDNYQKFDGSQPTFPKAFQAAGYQTAMIGKWHLVSDPTGFDYWNVLPGQGRYHDPYFIDMGERRQIEGYTTDIITDLALDWLRQKRDASRPFVLMVHHKAPHREWSPSEKYATLYDDRDIPEPATLDDDYATRSAAAPHAVMTIERHLTKTDVKADPPEGLSPEARKKWHYQRYIKDYLRCIASVDENIGRLLDGLDALGLAKDTVVVYTSDQGFFLGDHGWYDKRFMYEEALRMPLLIRYPGRIKPGSVCDAMVLNVDFAPTFLDLAGLAPQPGMQGVSFRPWLLGQRPDDWRDAMYYHYYEYAPGGHLVRPHYGIRTARYKLMHFYAGLDAWELYDLEKDPHELKNVYGDPAYEEITRDLKAQMKKLQQELGDTPDVIERLTRESNERTAPRNP